MHFSWTGWKAPQTQRRIFISNKGQPTSLLTRTHSSLWNEDNKHEQWQEECWAKECEGYTYFFNLLYSQGWNKIYKDGNKAVNQRSDWIFQWSNLRAAICMQPENSLWSFPLAVWQHKWRQHNNSDYILIKAVISSQRQEPQAFSPSRYFWRKSPSQQLEVTTCLLLKLCWKCTSVKPITINCAFKPQLLMMNYKR